MWGWGSGKSSENWRALPKNFHVHPHFYGAGHDPDWRKTKIAYMKFCTKDKSNFLDERVFEKGRQSSVFQGALGHCNICLSGMYKDLC